MSLFRRSRRRRGKWSIPLVLLFLGVALDPADSEAQSGRRATSPASPVTTNPSSGPGAVTAAANEPSPGKLPTKVKLLVARQPTSKHLPTEDRILASFIKQLNRYENIEATSIGDHKEGDTVERAKEENSAYVILMKFDIDNFKNGTIIINSQDLEVEYFVLAPHTGKRQTKGKVYFQGIGGGMMRKSDWPNGTPIKVTPEGAGIEAADGLYFWLKLVANQKVEQGKG